MTNRRDFIASAAMAAAGCAAKTSLASFAAPGEIRAFLLHLGHNMWCDWFPEDVDLKAAVAGMPAGRTPLPDAVLRSKDELWRQVTDHIAAKGMNMIVIDLGEGLVYPSHPELAIKGSWTPEKLRAEIARLNKLGIGN